ncbi:AI-2E family transporter [Robbsia andropogonis]|uniref:AI-2E family transporter n=1 Tax=Robbsia andropogonis TaxID=28092 RepID=UPI000465BFD1|nr:AI-2E family transporter [Robbsia andropogonis]
MTYQQAGNTPDTQAQPGVTCDDIADRGTRVHDAAAEAAQGAAATGRSQHTALLCLYGVLTLLAVWVVHSYVPAVLWAGVLAIALWPALEKVERWRGLNGRPRLVAALVVSCVAVVFVLPLILALSNIGGDTHALMDQVRTVQENGLPAPAWLGRLPFASVQATTWWNDNLADPHPGKALLSHVPHGSLMTVGGVFGKRLLHALITFAFMLLVLFFIFAAGTSLREQALRGIGRFFGQEGRALATQMAVSVRGTVSGLVLVGLGEGALMCISYFIAKVPHAVLLGALTAVTAMLPFCAPVLIAGVGAYLLVQGATGAAIAVLVWGGIIVFAAEHFVRPALIGGAARLPFLLVLLGILGGAETLGLLGIFIGPALMTILMVLWRDYVQG